MKIVLFLTMMVLFFGCQTTNCVSEKAIEGYEICTNDKEIVITFKDEKYAKSDIAILGTSFILKDSEESFGKDIKVKSLFYSDSIIYIRDKKFIEEIAGLYSNENFSNTTEYILDSLNLRDILLLDVLFNINNEHKKYTSRDDASFTKFMVQSFSEGKEKEVRESLLLSLLFKVRDHFINNKKGIDDLEITKNIVLLKNVLKRVEPSYNTEKTVSKFIADLEKKESGVHPQKPDGQ